MAEGFEHLSTAYQRRLVGRLRELVATSSKTEQDIESEYANGAAECDDRHSIEQQAFSQKYQSDRERLEKEYLDGLTDARLRYETQLEQLTREEVANTDDASRAHKKAIADAKYQWFLARRQCRRDHEADRRRIVEAYGERRRSLGECKKSLRLLQKRVEDVLLRRGCLPEPHSQSHDAVPEPGDEVRGVERFNFYTEWISSQLHGLRQTPTSRFVDEKWGLLLGLLAFLAILLPAKLVLQWNTGILLVASALAAAAVSVTAHCACVWWSRKQTQAAFPILDRALREARRAHNSARRRAKKSARRRLQETAAQFGQRGRELSTDWQRQLDQFSTRYEASREAMTAEFAERRETATRRWNDEIGPIRQKFVPLIESGKRQFEAAVQRLQAEHRRERDSIEENHRQRWQSLTANWTSGLEELQRAVDSSNAYCEQLFPSYQGADWTVWKPAIDTPAALRFGHYVIDLNDWQQNASVDERLRLEQTTFSLPSILTFPSAPSLLLKASDHGRSAAVVAMCNVILRLLTSLPPGKVRLTVVDPTGLGENFSAFMHLADYDERLVNSRIWTEASHINQRLADLTEHMENVIQKYLRNEFQSIQQYNDYAGEIAEAFHVLVVANFPANFSEEAARRLVSIMSSGPRCGVYTLISVDEKMRIPRNFDLADLEINANTLQWRDGQFHWDYPELSDFAVQLDSPPEEHVMTAALRAVGEYAKDANRVEVSFSTVVPSNGKWWSSDASDEIEIPLGRAGATKLQTLRLGRGTSQHVLISGKTGSGKSTLLHALITNVALHYSPDEVQFYLVDFKKGVEFKPYAELQLPHGRVIAIESEREFGMSVLERVDLELRNRGDLFRRCSVQSLAGYRKARPGEPLPRLLLVIDEFQEFFVKDDKISRDAALLLDRLVRQGRAFGIHVLLGSQTLAGTYTLARSTIGQMAVRIALQCSSADAHLILSEDNDAARLLRRPGEAIYNDANGLFEGNHLFQVVWLPDDEKESYLQQLKELSASRDMDLPRPVVFEGNVPADIGDNQLLQKTLAAPAPGETPLAPRAWVGESIAIADPPAVVFQRRSGSNLLIVGQGEESAVGILAGCLISLAAFSANGRGERHASATRFYVLDGSRLSSADTGWWQHLATRLPLDVRVVAPREAADTIAKISSEIDARLESENDTAPAVFLFVHNLARFRSLKKTEDDFGFSTLDEGAAASPAARLGRILREGPDVGVHSLIWCDLYNNLMRWMDRQCLHDFEMRVLFQMSMTDSNNLMDSPAASGLGTHRALLYSEDQGDAAKFRPYERPGDDWLARAKQLFELRSRGTESRQRSS